MAAHLSGHLNTRYFGRQVHYLASTTSTQDVARDLATGGAETGTVVIAGTQRSGRGRLGRTWFSPEGSLAMSVITRPAQDELRLLPAVSSLAVFNALKGLGIPAVIKWPNDLLINGKKVCGILIESQAPANGQPFSIIGIGVNVDFDTRRFPEIAEIATSISAHLEDKITVEEVALRVLNELEPLYYRIADSEGIRALWLDGMETIGRRVSVNTGKAIEHGIADTVDEAGNLVLRRDDNSLLTVIAGDVTLLKD